MKKPSYKERDSNSNFLASTLGWVVGFVLAVCGIFAIFGASLLPLRGFGGLAIFAALILAFIGRRWAAGAQEAERHIAQLTSENVAVKTALQEERQERDSLKRDLARSEEELQSAENELVVARQRLEGQEDVEPKAEPQPLGAKIEEVRSEDVKRVIASVIFDREHSSAEALNFFMEKGFVESENELEDSSVIAALRQAGIEEPIIVVPHELRPNEGEDIGLTVSVDERDSEGRSEPYPWRSSWPKETVWAVLQPELIHGETLTEAPSTEGEATL